MVRNCFHSPRRSQSVIALMMILTIFVHLRIHHDQDDHTSARRVQNNTAVTEPLGDGLLYQAIERAGAPFVAGSPKQLVIVGYQRVGSSFFGQIFDSNPGVSYIYEPLDAVYADMYGTADGFNVPSDITFTTNGTHREIPSREREAVESALSDIVHCRVDHLSAGFLLHKYWYHLVDSFMPSWKPYARCLRDHGVLKAKDSCWNKRLNSICAARFGTDSQKQDFCQKGLVESQAGDPTPFGEYKKCLQKSLDLAQSCVSQFKNKCDESSVRAVKTVRGTMVEMYKLLESNPNLRIIHLIRGPRPVVVSRSTNWSYRGIYAGDTSVKHGGNRVKEAHIYCGTVQQDLEHRYLLEDKYPGRIIQVIYEDFVQNPQLYTEAIYKFLDQSIPLELTSWIRTHTAGHTYKNNAIVRMNAWKAHITYDEGEKVKQQCKQLYKMLNYKWPYHE